MKKQRKPIEIDGIKQSESWMKKIMKTTRKLRARDDKYWDTKKMWSRRELTDFIEDYKNNG